MKLKYSIAGLLLIITSACNKDFLEIVPQTAVSSTTFYRTEEDFLQATNGVYAGYINLYSDAYVMGEMRSDNTHYILKANDRGTQNVGKEQIADFLNDGNNGYVANKWTRCYTIIARANQVLANIDAVSFDENKKNNFKGQSLFLRAFAYFDLVQYFGDVPLHLVPSTSQADVALPKTPKAEIYDKLIGDLTQAATLMPARAAQEKGRATSGSAKTLLGYIYMTLKRYAEAETVLKEVTSMGYDLLPSYDAVFALNNKNSIESIFEIQHMQGTLGVQSSWAYQFIPGVSETLPITGIGGNNSAIGGWNTPTDDLIKSYEAGDTRKDASIGYYNVGGIDYPYIKKYLHPHTNYNNTDDNWPVFRYADVLLLLTEALNEQNKPAEALLHLNKVRDRAFGAGVSPITTTDQSLLRDIIAKERRVELAFENHRWLDLVRTGKAIQVMTAYGAVVKANPTVYYYPPGTAPLAQSYNVTEANLLFPIPESQIIINPLLR